MSTTDTAAGGGLQDEGRNREGRRTMPEFGSSLVVSGVLSTFNQDY